MTSPELQSTFNSWLDQALAGSVPSETVAFSFNLAEPWCIEIIGASRYSDDDPDWACDEVFRPDIENLELPQSEVGSDWETVLESAKELISRYLERQSIGSGRLKNASAVAVGFVDGDLQKIWPR